MSNHDDQDFKKLVSIELNNLLVKDSARSLFEEARITDFTLPKGLLASDPLPEGPPELIDGLLLAHGSTGLIGEKECGKGQPLDAKVLTPTGWVRMGDLRVGDVLASPDGQVSHVVAVHPKKEQQVYRVLFSDGRATETDDDHLWEMWHPNWDGTPVWSFCAACGQRELPQSRESRVLSTNFLRNAPPSIQKLAHIYAPEALTFGSTGPLPVHPWLLGALLGDGSLSGGSVQFTTADPDLVVHVQSVLPADVRVSKLRGTFVYSITQVTRTGNSKNSVLTALRELGLMGKRAWEKTIPDLYLWADRDARVQLLAGLIDTDGYVSSKGDLSVCTTSPIMATQIQWLARSLGCVATLHSKQPFYRNTAGEKVWCRTAYNIHIAHSAPQQFAMLERKRNKLAASRRQPWLSVSSITPSRVVETRCITVSHPKGLYITDDFIVTHNSLTALEIQHSLITGEPLWGALKPNATIRRSVHFYAEHSCRTIMELYRAMQFPPTDQITFYGPEHLREMKLIISSGIRRDRAVSIYKRLAEGAGLVVFDPIAAFVQGEGAENDNAQMRHLVDSMIDIARDVGAACLVLGHQGKAQLVKGEYRSRANYATRGASSIEDALTAVLYLNRKEGSIGGRDLYEILPKHYKGKRTRKSFQLLRDRETLRQTLLTESLRFA